MEETGIRESMLFEVFNNIVALFYLLLGWRKVVHFGYYQRIISLLYSICSLFLFQTREYQTVVSL